MSKLAITKDDLDSDGYLKTDNLVHDGDVVSSCGFRVSGNLDVGGNLDVSGNRLHPVRPILRVGYIGSRNTHTVFYLHADGSGISAKCGCRDVMGLDALERIVHETYSEGNQHRVEYDAAFTLARTVYSGLRKQ